MNGSDKELSIGVKNIDRNYQISPLEYPDKETNEITLPHDNLPPYMKMYIWECTELTDEEREITGEPKDNKCRITWLFNGAVRKGMPDVKSHLQTRDIGGAHNADIPVPEGDPNESGRSIVMVYANHDFIGWKDMSGQIKTEDEIVNRPVSGNETYVAQWKPKKCTIIFNSNNGVPATMKREYNYGDKIGYFPSVDEFPDKAIRLDGWWTASSGGTRRSEEYVVTYSTTLYAHWTYSVATIYRVNFYRYNGNSPYKFIDRAEGARIGEGMDNPTRTGYTFKGWFTAKTGGDQVFAT